MLFAAVFQAKQRDGVAVALAHFATVRLAAGRRCRLPKLR